MKSIVRGWRQKMAYVTLLMAVVCTGAWIRSLSFCEILLIPIGTRQEMFCSIEGRVYWWGATQPECRWDADSIDFPIKKTLEQLNGERTILQSSNGAQFVEWIIPYWTFAIPLTFFAAWLLLGPLRNLPIKNVLANDTCRTRLSPMQSASDAEL